MRYNRFGSTGLVVSELCLGAMTFGTKPSGFFTHDLDQAGSTALVRQALDAGVNLIDTANLYSAGQSEEFVGGALRALGAARDQRSEKRRVGKEWVSTCRTRWWAES